MERPAGSTASLPPSAAASAAGGDGMRRPALSASLALAVALACAPVAALAQGLPPGVKTFSAKDVIEGTKVSREACAATPRTVFVESFGQGICIRYYLSGPVKGQAPIVFFTGDVLGLDDKGRREVDPGYLTQAPEFIDIASKVWAGRLKAPMLFFGRMGMNGSSGWHGDRRTALEVDVTEKALDAIAAKEGATGFHLVGQSGGAMLVPALLASRDDVGCAVIASGPLDFRAFTRAYGITFRTSGARAHYDPMADVAKIAPKIAGDGGSRLFVLTDPKDTAVPAKFQAPFVAALEKAGGRPVQIFTGGRDKDHHALIEKALFVAGQCVGEASDAEIVQRWQGRAGDDLPR